MLGCRTNLRCALSLDESQARSSITSVVCITCFISMCSNPPMLSFYFAPKMFFYVKHLSIISGQDRQEPIERWRNAQKAEFIFKDLLNLCSLGQQQWALFLYTLANWFLLLIQTCFHSSIDLLFYLQNVLGYLGLGYSAIQYSPVKLIYSGFHEIAFCIVGRFSEWSPCL